MVPSNTYNMLQCFCGLVYLSAILAFATLTGTQAACPLQLNPQRVVVRYDDSVAAYCNTSVPHQGMGWEASEGAVPMTKDQSLITWTVSELTEWDIKPVCYINQIHSVQCVVVLPVTVYKTPDSVSISTVNHSGPMIEGKQYELQCDVHDVAPVQDLTVKWYKGQTLLDQTTFTDTIETPVNETVTLLIRPDRADDGAQYRCEAELDLGAEGPQPPPTKTSKPLNVEVYYKPKHSNSTETIIKKDEATLDCTVKANPAPRYIWHSDHLEEEISSSVLQSSALTPGNYTCTATNALGTDSKVFIVKSTDRTTFWAIVLSGVAVAVVLIASYLAMAVQGTREAMVDQETWEAVADQETWEAMADLPPRPRPQPPPRLLRLKPYYPPKKKYLVELTVLNLGTGARPGLNWGSGALTGLDSGTGASPGTNVTS